MIGMFNSVLEKRVCDLERKISFMEMYLEALYECSDNRNKLSDALEKQFRKHM